MVNAVEEAEHPGEPAVDVRQKLRTRPSLDERLLQQRNRSIRRLELGEQQERPDARRVGSWLRQQARRERSRARPFAGRVMRSGGSKQSRTTHAGAIWGGQSERMLGEIGRTGRRTATGRERRRRLEDRRHLLIRCATREREVLGVHQRLVDEGRDPAVDGPPLFAQVAVQHRGEQRMRERNHRRLHAE